MNQIDENGSEQLADAQVVDNVQNEFVKDDVKVENDNVVTNSNNDIDVQDGLQDEQANKLIELEKKALELEDKEKNLNLRQLRMDTIGILYNKNLPVDMIDFIIGDDVESTKSKIDKFEVMFNNAVQKNVEQRLKGKVPVVGNAFSSNDDYKSKVRSILGS